MMTFKKTLFLLFFSTIFSLPVSGEILSISSSTIVAGKNLNISLNGADGQEYKFISKNPAGEWYTERKYSQDKNFVFKPNSYGEWRLVLHIREVGSVNSYDESEFIDINVLKNGDTTLPSLIFYPDDTDFYQGEERILSAVGLNENEFFYRFYLRDPEGNWSLAQDYSTSPDINWVPKLSGNWRVVVHVKNKNSNKRFDNYAYFDQFIEQARIINPENIVFNINGSSVHPRNSEGSFLKMQNGKLLFLYNQFYGVSDGSSADIVGIESHDNGSTWSWPPSVYVKNNAEKNVMNPSLLEVDGKIFLFYLKKNNWHDTKVYLTISEDEGQSWSNEKVVTNTPGYYVLNNDRVIQTETGRIILPVAYHRPKTIDPYDNKTFDYRGIALWFYSDDQGDTWKESGSMFSSPVFSKSGLQEPGVVQISFQYLYSWARSDQGYQYQFFSLDNGLSWSSPEESKMNSPLSPASIKYYPTLMNEVIAVYNDNNENQNRTPLVASFLNSSSFVPEKKYSLETWSEGTYDYTAIECFESDNTCLFAYSYRYPRSEKMSIRMRKISIDVMLNN